MGGCRSRSHATIHLRGRVTLVRTTTQCCQASPASDPSFVLPIMEDVAEEGMIVDGPQKVARQDSSFQETSGSPRTAIKRKRGHSRSPSPASARRTDRRSHSRSPPRRRNAPPITDVDPQRRRERERQLRERMAEEEAMEPVEKQAFDPKAEFERLMNTRAGGTYVPPARLRALQAAFKEKGTKEHQRMAWETLKKSINGLINKVNKSNIKDIAPALFEENLVRGCGLYARSIMRAQAASLPFTPIYAAITAIINTKLPQVGELLLTRLIVQLRKAFKRNDKAVCLSATTFIAHLCNQQVAHEIVALQILALLLERPTNDSVEIAVGFMREVGQYLAEVSPKANTGVFERFRTTLHEASIDKRVQYMIEVLFQIRKEKFKDHPTIPEELDLVEEEDQITHYLSLDDELDVQEKLGIFQFDEEYEENEQKYNEIKKEILGDDSDEEDGDEGAEDAADGAAGEDETAVAQRPEEKRLEILDETNTNLTNLRRTIYLTIMSSVDFEECTHKLLKVRMASGQERELCNMVIECCSQERTYSRFYGLIAGRFCNLNRFWTENFEQCFMTYYETIHRYDANKLRNIARLFGHLLAADAFTWQVLQCVHLNEEETTSSSRIFIKILFQELVEALGLKKLVERLNDPSRQNDYAGLFPRDDPKNTRFSINYFTSIGLGAITESMREHLKNLPKPPPRPATPSTGSESGSYSSDSRSSRSYSSDSRSRSRSRSLSHSQSPRRRIRDRRSSSYSSRDSRSRSRGRGKASPAPRKLRPRSPSRAASPSRHEAPSRGRPRRRSVESRSSYYSRSRSRSRSSSGTSRSRSRSSDGSGSGYGRRGGRGSKVSGRQSRDSSRTVSPSRSRSRSRSESVSRSRSRRRVSRTPERRRRSLTPVPSTTRARQGRETVRVYSRGRSRTRSRSPRRSRSRPQVQPRSQSRSPVPAPREASRRV